MKEIKKLIPAYIISFVSGFMFFFYEPFTLYATNRDDFWFDVYIMILPTILLFMLYIIIACGIYTLIYFVNKKYFEGKKIYETAVTIGFALLIGFYIQGNYFIGGLPSLDGTKIEWIYYRKASAISAVIFAIPMVATFYSIKKYEFKKCAKVYSFICVAICIMLSTSLLTTAMSKDISAKKGKYLVPTEKNLHTASENKNFYIFLLDAVDSKQFNYILQNSEDKDLLNDFTYYPDTVCGYPFTRDSIPFILSGKWNENETEFYDYYNTAMDESALIDKLIEQDYCINIYDDDNMWNSEKASNIDNFNANTEMDIINYWKNVSKYVIFKYFPYYLKFMSKIETMNFDNCIAKTEYENFLWWNRPFYDKIREHKTLEKEERNYFEYIHLEGAHVDFNLDKDLNYVEDGTYEQKLEACVTLTKEFINRLKENGTYDNSVIIILADHGYNESDFKGRQNPILYIKGIDEHHEEKTSDIPVSYEDLSNAYIELLDGKKSDELFTNIDTSRKRRFILYEYGKENHMIEYEQTGTADNIDTLVPTGREFNN